MEDWQKQFLKIQVDTNREFDAVYSRISDAEGKANQLEAELDALQKGLEFLQNRVATVEKKIDAILEAIGSESMGITVRDFVAWKAGE
ncbi:MAG: hypothetical protein ACTSYX_04915 [Candidatus Thorarchaeota archaeon]